MQKLKGGKMEETIRNRARCTKCNDVIESEYTHDFVWCKCKTIFIDGGKSYWKAGGDFKYFLRIWDDGRETPIAFKPIAFKEDEKDSDSKPIDINDLLFYNIRSN